MPLRQLTRCRLRLGRGEIMDRPHDVHVFPNVLHGGWKTTQGKRVLANHATFKRAIVIAIRRARRDRVDVVTHRRSGRIRSKDSYGNESPARDTEH